jgi:hypothetical protein
MLSSSFVLLLLPDASRLWLHTNLLHFFLQASVPCENKVEIAAKILGIVAPICDDA